MEVWLNPVHTASSHDLLIVLSLSSSHCLPFLPPPSIVKNLSPHFQLLLFIPFLSPWLNCSLFLYLNSSFCFFVSFPFLFTLISYSSVFSPLISLISFFSSVKFLCFCHQLLHFLEELSKGTKKQIEKERARERDRKETTAVLDSVNPWFCVSETYLYIVRCFCVYVQHIQMCVYRYQHWVNSRTGNCPRSSGTPNIVCESIIQWVCGNLIYYHFVWLFSCTMTTPVKQKW